MTASNQENAEGLHDIALSPVAETQPVDRLRPTMKSDSRASFFSSKILSVLVYCLLLSYCVRKLEFRLGDATRIPLLALASIWTKEVLTRRSNKLVTYVGGVVCGYMLSIIREGDVIRNVWLEGLVILAWKMGEVVLGRPWKKEEEAREEESVDEGKLKRMWLSMIIQAVINHVSPVKVPLFDVGRVWPSIRMKGAPKMIREGKGGFEMAIEVDYRSDESTNIKALLPMTVLGCKRIEVPIVMSEPHVASSLQLECKVGKEEGAADSAGQKYLALSIQFDPIREFRIGQLKISIASNIHLLQYIPGIKKTLKSLVDRLSAPNLKRVVVLDSAFQVLGYFELERNQIWEIDQLLGQEKKLTTNQRRLFPSKPDQIPSDDFVAPDLASVDFSSPLSHTSQSEDDQCVLSCSPSLWESDDIVRVPNFHLEAISPRPSPSAPDSSPSRGAHTRHIVNPWEHQPSPPLGKKRAHSDISYPSLHIH